MMNNNPSRLGTVLLSGAILAILAIGLMVSGARFGLWEPITGFGLVQTYLNPVAYSVSGLAVLGLIHQLATRNRRGIAKTFVAMLIGMGLLAPMVYATLNPPRRLPPIHDITTDTGNPPRFMVLDDTRAGARNSLVYGGADVAAIQKQLYPEIGPIQSTRPASQAFAKARRIADEAGWEIVAEDPDQLRFEATARTPVYGFMDDVVVVVTASGGGSRVDIRSVSRVGRSDKGVNAARINAFVREFGE